MNNVFAYLKRFGELNLEERPFCEVDSLILSQFVYLKVDGMVPRLKENKEAVSIGMLYEHPKREQLFSDIRFARNNRKLFELMYKSKRFCNMQMNYYVNIVDEQIETQFCAMLITLESNYHYIAFRGTDETIVGWKEDFCMAFTRPIPSQDYSVIYVTQIADRIKGKLSLGGHSKGGNLAVYAALRCPRDVADRIRRIYSFDGPGFRPEVLRSDRYVRMRKRICKVIPQSSIVGMVLQNKEKCKIVKSTAAGVWQHDPYTWMIKDGDFVCIKSLHRGSRVRDRALNEWILSMTQEQLHRFVDNLFDLFYASMAQDLIALEMDRKKSIRNMMEAYKEMDTSEKRFMIHIIGKLLLIQSKGLLELVRSKG